MMINSWPRSEQLNKCQKTRIQSPLLKELLQHITINDFHHKSRNRQVLSFILRSALGVVRLPGSYDIRYQQAHFDTLNHEALLKAIKDAKRIYDHTQSQMRSVFEGDTIKLTRGISDIEAEVVLVLRDHYEGETIPFFLSSLTFFNHVSGAFTRPVTISIDCPIKWIWASEYTLEELTTDKFGYHNSCEEFIVCCTNINGSIPVPKSEIRGELNVSPSDLIFPYLPSRGEQCQTFIAQALSVLAHEGFDPDNGRYPRPIYYAGGWERKLQKLGRQLDRLLSAFKISKGSRVEVLTEVRNPSRNHR
jgi:hypothetical protein